MIRIPRPATAKARNGDTSAGTTTLSTRPAPLTAFEPAAANVAPTIPPISACDEDAGRPKYQVARFQAIAPTSPAKTIGSVMYSGLTMPLAIVAATEIDR